MSQKAKQTAGHLLHLRLERLSVAGDRLLDLQRGVFKDRNPLELRRQKNHAARLRDADDGLGVVGVKELFDGEGFRLALVDDFERALEDRLQTPLKRRFGTGGNGAVFHGDESRRVVLHNAEADERITGVDSHNDHNAVPSLQLLIL